MSHEVDLLEGLSRVPSDFKQRLNTNFLEDHVFLVRTAVLGKHALSRRAAAEPGTAGTAPTRDYARQHRSPSFYDRPS